MDGGRGVTHRAFSFSGIKTAVRQHLQREGLPALAEGEALEDREDLLAVLAGFQETVTLITPVLALLLGQAANGEVLTSRAWATSWQVSRNHTPCTLPRTRARRRIMPRRIAHRRPRGCGAE